MNDGGWKRSDPASLFCLRGDGLWSMEPTQVIKSSSSGGRKSVILIYNSLNYTCNFSKEVITIKVTIRLAGG